MQNPGYRCTSHQNFTIGFIPFKKRTNKSHFVAHKLSFPSQLPRFPQKTHVPFSTSYLMKQAKKRELPLTPNAKTTCRILISPNSLAVDTEAPLHHNKQVKPFTHLSTLSTPQKLLSINNTQIGNLTSITNPIKPLLRVKFNKYVNIPSTQNVTIPETYFKQHSTGNKCQCSQHPFTEDFINNRLNHKINIINTSVKILGTSRFFFFFFSWNYNYINYSLYK